jgi:hypothetical protein
MIKPGVLSLLSLQFRFKPRLDREIRIYRISPSTAAYSPAAAAGGLNSGGKQNPLISRSDAELAAMTHHPQLKAEIFRLRSGLEKPTIRQ